MTNNGCFPEKYNWTLIGDSVIADYLGGQSTFAMGTKYDVPVSAITAFLGRKGVRRTYLQAKAVARVHGRITNKPARSRICAICQETYQPTGPNQQRCVACIPNSRFKEYYSRYRVSKRDWDRILLAQGGTCALCPLEAEHIDHCHLTGVVRGLLCPGCNLALNRVEKVGWVARATSYVENSDTGCRVSTGSVYWMTKQKDKALRKRQVDKPIKRPDRSTEVAVVVVDVPA